MAAYAALLSVMHIIDQLQNHPRPPISLQKKQVESLTKKLAFLQEFLEHYNPHEVGYTTEADPFESRIADAAYAAEDVIESHIVDQITNHGIFFRWKKKFGRNGIYQELEKVIKAMASLEKEAMEIKESMEGQHQLHRNSTPLHYFRSSSMTQQQNSSKAMVGVADVVDQLKDKLIGGRPDLQIIPIVGMGGTGKTTLARNIYQEPLIKEHFQIRAWATVSQEYSITDVFKELSRELSKEVVQNLSEAQLVEEKMKKLVEKEKMEKLVEEVEPSLSDNELIGEKLYKHLWGRKYFIVMDDMWSIDPWDRVRRFFPDNKNGSRVIITTRLSNLLSNDRLEMRLLDESSSWDLLSKTVFREKGCPVELEEIGKKIGKSCRGLPLSIVVVGGLLAKSKHTVEFWEYVEKNLSSVVNLEDNNRCLRILHMSYKQLPVHLKPCFLYMGVFAEDEVINISRLSKLWVGEGFVKPVKGKSLEEIAKEYLKDLIDRNLILIHKVGKTGNIKYCKIHDLLRNLCLGEAEKERFYVAQGVRNIQRRVVISSTSEKKEAVDDLQLQSVSVAMTIARSLISSVEDIQPFLLNSRLLRVFHSNYHTFPCLEDMLRLVNLRYLSRHMSPWNDSVFSSLYKLWNLETLIVEGEPFSSCTLPAEIWSSMPKIRHVEFQQAYLEPPPSGGDNGALLKNLQTLARIKNFKCSEEVVKRIPNIKKLRTFYTEVEGTLLCLNNLVCLHELDSFDCIFVPKMNPSGLESLSFPQSLKKLKLRIDFYECWDDILEKIGALPRLEKLQLTNGCFEACKWETVEDHFPSLKYLEIYDCESLKEWTMESSHFPRLEHLVLDRMEGLTEIPVDVADISTLESIKLKYCSESVVFSAERIIKEQEEMQGEVALQVRVILKKENEALESLASPNIRVEIKKINLVEYEEQTPSIEQNATSFWDALSNLRFL